MDSPAPVPESASKFTLTSTIPTVTSSTLITSTRSLLSSPTNTVREFVTSFSSPPSPFIPYTSQSTPNTSDTRDATTLLVVVSLSIVCGLSLTITTIYCIWARKNNRGPWQTHPAPLFADGRKASQTSSQGTLHSESSIGSSGRSSENVGWPKFLTPRDKAVEPEVEVFDIESRVEKPSLWSRLYTIKSKKSMPEVSLTQNNIDTMLAGISHEDEWKALRRQVTQRQTAGCTYGPSRNLRPDNAYGYADDDVETTVMSHAAGTMRAPTVASHGVQDV